MSVFTGCQFIKGHYIYIYNSLRLCVCLRPMHGQMAGWIGLKLGGWGCGTCGKVLNYVGGAGEAVGHAHG